MRAPTPHHPSAALTKWDIHNCKGEPSIYFSPSIYDGTMHTQHLAAGSWGSFFGGDRCATSFDVARGRYNRLLLPCQPREQPHHSPEAKQDPNNNRHTLLSNTCDCTRFRMRAKSRYPNIRVSFFEIGSYREFSFTLP